MALRWYARWFATACVAGFALLAAGCGDFPDGASARELVLERASSTPSPREFLEVGAGDASRWAAGPAPGAAAAPESVQRWGWAVRAKGDVLVVYEDPRPGAALRMGVDATNPWDQRIAFPIRDVRVVEGRSWYRVLLGIEPNGAKGWVRGDDVTFDRMRHRVIVDLSERVLRHYRDGTIRHRFAVGIGAPGTPTTAGRFFVWAQLEPNDPSGPYGSYLLGLSGFSEVLTDWPGGGRMAIHGTADPSDRGARVSFGCARVYNPQMNRLRNIPIGTTVLIRR